MACFCSFLTRILIGPLFLVRMREAILASLPKVVSLYSIISKRNATCHLVWSRSIFGIRRNHGSSPVRKPLNVVARLNHLEILSLSGLSPIWQRLIAPIKCLYHREVKTKEICRLAEVTNHGCGDPSPILGHLSLLVCHNAKRLKPHEWGWKDNFDV